MGLISQVFDLKFEHKNVLSQIYISFQVFCTAAASSEPEKGSNTISPGY